MYNRTLDLIRAPLFAVPLLTAVACSSPTGPSNARHTVTPFDIVALGDSLTAGPGLSPSETWPGLLQQRMRQNGYPHTMINAGVSGDTTAAARRRLDAALAPAPGIVIVALGANDGLRGIAVEEIRANLSAIVTSAQARGARVLLCGMETPPLHGWDYSLAFHRIFPDLSREHDVPLVPFLLAGVVGNPELNLGDGIHPNAAGMRRIAEEIWLYLEPMIR